MVGLRYESQLLALSRRPTVQYSKNYASEMPGWQGSAHALALREGIESPGNTNDDTANAHAFGKREQQFAYGWLAADR